MRVLVYDHDDTPAFDLPINDVFELIRTESLNGEHNIKITTTHVLTKGQRLLTKDATGKWYEWVVMGADEEHSTGKRPVGTYYCPWSIQHDLMGVMCYKQPGTSGTLVNATRALEDALSETNRWEVGTVDVSKTSSGSMWRMSAWEALSVLTTNWGGEIDAEITVSGTGVVRRQVSLKTAIGQTTAKRRFDWSHDVESITRKVGDDPNVCRIVPLGAAQETENGGYGRKITIESVNSGKDYLENANVKNYYRLPDGNGGWEYPTKVVENQEIDDPAKLKAWAQSILVANTTPVVTYEANVLQLAQAGMNTKGLGLGDVVQVVDKGFYDEGLRLEGRVIKQEINELSGEINVEIGNLAPTLAQTIRTLAKTSSNALSLATVLNGGSTSTADVMTRWLERLNADINATGGYTYITEGQGIRTYDRAVSDPLVGSEATSVVEVKGGSIRIANTKTAGGEWEWKTVFVSGHIAANLVTAAAITTGFIGSSGDTYINLDEHIVNLGKSNKGHVVVDDSGLYIYDNNTLVGMFTLAGQQIGAKSNTFVYSNASSWGFYPANSTVPTTAANALTGAGETAITASAMRVGAYSGQHLYTDANGVSVCPANVNNTSLTGGSLSTFTADGMRVGKYSTKHLFTDGNVLSFSNANQNDAEAHSTNSTFMIDGTTPSMTFGSRATGSGGDSFKVGSYSVAFGNSVIASGLRSFAGGNTTTASGQYSFVWGDSAQASANYAVAFGKGLANGQYSMAIGDLARTTENATHGVALGQGTLVTRAYEFGFGRYNEPAKGYAYINPTTGQTETVYSIFSVGNGYDADNRHNALTLYDNGLLQATSLALTEPLRIGNGGTGSTMFGRVTNPGNGGTKNVANDTLTNLHSIALEKGKWIVTAQFYFGANSNGVRQISIDNADNVGGTTGRTKRAHPTNSGAFVDDIVAIVELSENKILYANCLQTSGTTLSAWAYMKAVQLQ